MAQGYLLNSDIEGAIQMKSFLAGNPELKLALNEELVVGKGACTLQINVQFPAVKWRGSSCGGSGQGKRTRQRGVAVVLL